MALMVSAFSLIVKIENDLKKKLSRFYSVSKINGFGNKILLVFWFFYLIWLKNTFQVEKLTHFSPCSIFSHISLFSYWHLGEIGKNFISTNVTLEFLCATTELWLGEKSFCFKLLFPFFPKKRWKTAAKKVS